MLITAIWPVMEDAQKPRGLVQHVTVIALLCAALSTSAGNAWAQQGTFVPTGRMNIARAHHSATLLNNGKVLIAGGTTEDGLTKVVRAELYDPATGTFTFTGNMNIARSLHEVILLNDGMVLVFGGIGSYSRVGSPELYNPATGTFTLNGKMISLDFFGAATLLNNGKVLIAGGIDYNTGIDMTSAELYDPTTGISIPTGTMNIARAGHTATLLNNGMVLIAGGDTSAELYDPATGTFTLTGSIHYPLRAEAAKLLSNGKVLVLGGGCAELYTPETGIFTAGGCMSTANQFTTATLLKNGTVLVEGGNVNTTPLADAQVYDTTKGTFVSTGSMNTARAHHAAVSLNNGTALVTGGDRDPLGLRLGLGMHFNTTADAELYLPVAVSPTVLAFSGWPVGTPSASQTVTLTNNDSTALTITSIAISGANASDFAETDNCLGSVAAGASCTINLTFLPTAADTRTGRLAIVNNLSPSPMSVPLTGSGITATRTATPSSSSLTFASVMIGATSAAQDLTLSNTGNTALTISSMAMGGANGSDYVETDTCGGGVAAGASCTVHVTFAPTATGTRNGTLSISDDATNPQSPQVVALTGTGQDFSIASPAPTATVAAGQSATYSVSVSPGGGFNQAVSFSCTGAPSLSGCSVSPSSVTLNGSSASSVTVTVATTAPVMGFLDFPSTGPEYAGSYRGFVLVVVVALALMTSLVRMGIHRERSLAKMSLLVLTLCIGITLTSCGGGSEGVTHKPGTQAGTYSLTVSGTFTSGSTTLVRNTKLTLIVQ